MIEFDKDVINMLRQMEDNAATQGRELASSVDEILFRQSPEDQQVYNAAVIVYPIYSAAGLGTKRD